MAKARSRSLLVTTLQRVQEVDQVRLLLVSKANVESLVVEIDQILQLSRVTGVEEGCPRGQSAQNRHFKQQWGKVQ